MKKFTIALAVLFLLCFILGGCGSKAVEIPNDNYRNFYEVFVYSYCDGNGDGTGDLQGLTSKIDYIADLGYTGIWLMPVMSSPSYHKYDTTDYYSIDEAYGSTEDFDALVSACHERGIKVIIDLMLNHTSTKHPWFTEAVEAIKRGEESKYIDYYNFSRDKSGIPVSTTGWYYEESFSGGNMPDLNLESASVNAEIDDILEYWLTKRNVDGFRLDAVTSYFSGNSERNVEYLKKITEKCKALKPDCYVVAEVWSDITTIGKYYESGVDSCFLFPSSQAEGYIASALRSAKPAKVYASAIESINDNIKRGIIAPFLGNHDTARAVNFLSGRKNLAKVKFAEGITGMLGGATFTYYGEEIGMTGSGVDQNKRIAMLWSDDADDLTVNPAGTTVSEYAYPSVAAQQKDKDSLLNYCKRLNALRNSVPEIARGETTVEFCDDLVCVLKKSGSDKTVFVAINFSAEDGAQFDMSAFTAKKKILGKLTVNTADKITASLLPPYSILVFE